jgi:hypothetical protein
MTIKDILFNIFDDELKTGKKYSNSMLIKIINDKLGIKITEKQISNYKNAYKK